MTLTTTGFGDITPIHPYARSLAAFEALIGTLYLAVLIARLVALEMEWREEQRERERGLEAAEAADPSTVGPASAGPGAGLKPDARKPPQGRTSPSSPLDMPPKTRS